MKLGEFWQGIGYPSAQETEYMGSALHELSLDKEKSGHAALVLAKTYFDQAEYDQCKLALAELVARLEEDTDHTYAGNDTLLFCRALTLCGRFSERDENVGGAQAYYLRAMLVADYAVAMRALLALSPTLSDGILANDSFTLNGEEMTKKSYAASLHNNVGVGCYLAMLLYMQSDEKSLWTCMAAETALLNSKLLKKNELLEVWYILALNEGTNLSTNTPVTPASLLVRKHPFDPIKYSAGVLLENGDIETLQRRLREGGAQGSKTQLQAIEMLCAAKQDRLAGEVHQSGAVSAEYAKQKTNRAWVLVQKIEEKDVRMQQEEEDAMRHKRNLRTAKERKDAALRKRQKGKVVLTKKRHRSGAKSTTTVGSKRLNKLFDILHILIILVIGGPALVLFAPAVALGASTLLCVSILLAFLVQFLSFFGADVDKCMNHAVRIAIIVAGILAVKCLISIVGSCVTYGTFNVLQGHITGGFGNYLINANALWEESVKWMLASIGQIGRYIGLFE